MREKDILRKSVVPLSKGGPNHSFNFGMNTLNSVLHSSINLSKHHQSYSFHMQEEKIKDIIP